MTRPPAPDVNYAEPVDIPGSVAEKLAAIPAEYANPPANLLSKLPKPISKDARKGNCPECGGYHGLPAVHLDYMGHADVTLALIKIDPEYDYGWLTKDDGSMLIANRDGRLVLEGWLEVHGKRRRCVGTAPASKGEPEKELIGDMLRNGAMRFGVATGLWSKSDGHESDDKDDTPPRDPERAAADETYFRLKALAETKDQAVVSAIRELGGQYGKGFSGDELRDAQWRAIVNDKLTALERKRAQDAAEGPTAPLEPAETAPESPGSAEDGEPAPTRRHATPEERERMHDIAQAKLAEAGMLGDGKSVLDIPEPAGGEAEQVDCGADTPDGPCVLNPGHRGKHAASF